MIRTRRHKLSVVLFCVTVIALFIFNSEFLLSIQIVDRRGPMMRLKETKTFGIVIVDVRRNLKTGPFLLDQIKQLLKTTPQNVPIEVWIGHKAKINDEVESVGNVHVRRMPETYSYGNYKTLKLTDHLGGHIGKAFALGHSQFDIPILLDGDVWPCEGWFNMSKNAILEGHHDVVWTKAPQPFGGTSGKNARAHWSSEVDNSVEEYSHFGERNTGTCVIVRSYKETVKQWLNYTLNLFVRQQDYATARDGVSTLRTPYTDQVAFRESFFVFRDRLSERILPNHVACRRNRLVKKCKCACSCSTCLLVHGIDRFKDCVAESKMYDVLGNG